MKKKVVVWLGEHDILIPKALLPGAIADAVFPRHYVEEWERNGVVDNKCPVGKPEQSIAPEERLILIDYDGNGTIPPDTKAVERYKYERMMANELARDTNLATLENLTEEQASAFLGKLEYSLEIRRFGGNSEDANRDADASLTKKRRTNSLDHIIDMAIQNAKSDNNTQAVWAEMRKLAEAKDPPPPLRGFAEQEGIKYFDYNGVKFLTKKALVERLKRRRMTR